MTDEQHMQKARKITARWRKSIRTENVRSDIASALSEAYRSGVEAERERAAQTLDEVAANIDEVEDDCNTWGGPDPRGPRVSDDNRVQAKRLRALATAIRKA
jgi:hypothetical protein